MLYFKSKIVQIDENTIKRFMGINETTTVYNYGVVGDTEYLGVNTEYTPEQVLSFQPTECEVEEVTYEEIREIAVNSAIAKAVNDIVGDKIREKYSENEEFKLINLGIADPTNTEYTQYREYVNSCRAWGNSQKQSFGIQ